MKLIFLYGLPGVGKLTVGRELAKQTNLRLFHNHMVLNLIIDVFGKETEPIIKLREDMWLDFFKQATQSNLEGLIFTFVFDKYLSKDFLQRIEQIVTPYGSVHYVELTCSIEELKRRIPDSSRKDLYKIQDVHNLLKQVNDGSFFVPKLKEDVLRIDTTHLSPMQTADVIKNKFLTN